MFRLPLPAAYLSAILLLAACAPSEEMQAMQQLPQYQAGYSDGCRSAMSSGSGFASRVTRNAVLFEEDPAYRAGWRDGSMSCGSAGPGSGNPAFESPRIGPPPL